MKANGLREETGRSRVAFPFGVNRCLVGLIAIVWLTSVPVLGAAAFTLVTPAEFARDQVEGRRSPYRGDAKGDMGSPNIVLVRPKAVDGVHSPTDIELRFIPKDPARIEPKSFRVLYGFFGIDVTDRILKHANVRPTGIFAKGASLPEGSHRLTVEISDSKERVGRKTFHLEVKE